MPNIPTFIEFVPEDNNQHPLRNNLNNSLFELDSFDIDMDTEYDDSITNQDLLDLKAMVQEMKHNPSLIYEKCSLPMLKSSMISNSSSLPTRTTENSPGHACVSINTSINELPSPPPRMRQGVQYCQECESPNTLSPPKFPKLNSNNVKMSSFPRLPVS
ncbi:hypothetical protein HJC23_013703 [Cyclotella cryptica]|uniref:Uncharacterized protein n=1 Tax=Cyclotella cryptica TaxID=29204 RepID=A0ABD3QVG6_9STRA|eukprot:CCRYP_001563-RA/>CCRYP_001563-RA protein AED:0.36 eAED:0.36 QI:0/-1/0/1/-1/1/1/0/158